MDCPICEGTGQIQTIVTQDVMVRGRQIIEDVAAKHGLSMAEIVGRSRTRRLIPARTEAVRRLRDETTLPLKGIGFLLGQRDHSTVMHYLSESARASAGN